VDGGGGGGGGGGACSLSAFTKLGKATINFVMSVCPSAWNNSAPTEGIFMKSDNKHFFICRRSSRFIEIEQD
jgi:hypothetical protein